MHSSRVPGIDREKHVACWRAGASEDLAAAHDLAERGHGRHALFFGHLAVEKALKGLVTARFGEIPPRTHDLLRLAEKAGLDPGEERSETMTTNGRYRLEGRYRETWGPPPTQEAVVSILAKVDEVIAWLATQS